MEKLSRIVREFVLIEGACAAGIATVETLEGDPPSSDLTYVLPNAQSAISYAVAIDQDLILPYLMKKNRLALEKEFIRANALASGIALHLANYLAQKGYPSVPVAANNVFRPPAPDTASDYIADLYYPDISHRYVAVRSGVGHMGWSGNIITKSQGAAVMLGATVTTAQLLPTHSMAPALFYIKGVAPKEVDFGQHIVAGTIPFIALQIIGVALIALFPQLALLLPKLMIH